MTDEAATDPKYHLPLPGPQVPPLASSLDLDDMFTEDGKIKIP
jgi:hypothetical protein